MLSLSLSPSLHDIAPFLSYSHSADTRVYTEDAARDSFRAENGFVTLSKLLNSEGDLQREAARLLLNSLFERTCAEVYVKFFLSFFLCITLLLLILFRDQGYCVAFAMRVLACRAGIVVCFLSL